LKALLPFGGDPINGALSAPRATFSLRRDAISPDLASWRTGVIKSANIDVGIALDQSIVEAAFDFIGMQVGAVQCTQDKKFCFHTLIKVLQLN